MCLCCGDRCIVFYEINSNIEIRRKVEIKKHERMLKKYDLRGRGFSCRISE